MGVHTGQMAHDLKQVIGNQNKRGDHVDMYLGMQVTAADTSGT